MSISAMQAAKVACQSSGWTLTNLQLHKILYIAHMVYAGNHNGCPLINDERFQAWAYGPVLPSVYRHASSHGSSSIQNIFNHVPAPDPTSEEYRVIADAVERLAELDPFRLVDITHEDQSAWAKTYTPGVKHAIIDQEAIMDEYRQRFPEEQA